MSEALGFSLVDGGPLCALMRRMGWTRPDGRVDYVRAGIVLMAMAWGPLLVATVWARLVSGHWFTIDWGAHARLLISIPLLLRAEVSLHARTRWAAEQFVVDDWAEGQSERFEHVVAGAVKHRNAVLPEAALFALALATSQLVVWNLGGMPFASRRVQLDAQMVAARWWYALVALPLFQFLVYRALWRWAIWVQVLWRLARLRLRPTATHPDQAGGLEFLSWPSIGFAYVIAALSTAQAGVWADQVLHAGLKVTALKAQVGALAAVAVVVALGPLVVLCPQLFLCQIEGRRQYGSLATDYTRLFQARWFSRRDRDDVLGSADIQSLADLANGYNVVAKMRLVPFSLRAVIAIVVAVLAPMIPVALLGVPLSQVLAKVAGALVGKPGG
jgi:hypothetical protein